MAPSGQVRPSNAAEDTSYSTRVPPARCRAASASWIVSCRAVQVVHRRVQVILITRPQVQDLAQGGGRGLLPQPAGDGQLGVRRDHLRDRHRGDQVPVPGRHRVDELVEAQLAGRAQDGGDVAVRQAAGDLERLVQAGGGRRLALQHPGQRVDLGLGPGRQVGQGPVLDLAGLAVAFPQQDRGR